MASGNVPPLSWTCPQCGQQVPAGQTTCPNCAAGAGAPPPPAPRRRPRPQPAPQPAPAPQPPPQQPPQPPQPQPPQQPQPAADEDEGWFNRYRTLIFVGGGLLLVILLAILMARGCGSGAQRASTPPPAASPAASAPAVVTATKPSPMPPATPAAPAKPLDKAPAQPRRAAISRSDIQREIRRAVEEALRAQQAQKGQPVEVKVNPPEITVRVVREEPSSVAPPPRREKLSDRELERRFKERLLQQEP